MNDTPSNSPTSAFQRLSPQPQKPRISTVEDAVFHESHEFDFFQAVSILESIYPDRIGVGKPGAQKPAVRFASHSASSSFAASSIYEITPATANQPVAKMTVGFMGLTGPSGILPQNYTDLLNRIEIEARGPEKYSLRDWFDLFNDRTISLFYQSWKKYRPYASYVSASNGEQDCFTSALQSIAGLGMPSLMKQCHKFVPQINETRKIASEAPPSPTNQLAPKQPQPEAAASRQSPIELALLRYSGLLAQRPRSASNLKNLLEDYFQLPVTVKQFHGNWLALDETAQTRLGVLGGNSVLSENAVVGDQTWERQNKILITIGPLNRHQFSRMLPEYQSEFGHNDYTLLVELIRLFVGATLEFDIQLTIESESIPEPKVSEDEQDGLRLGWNTWLSRPPESEVANDTLLSVD